MKRTLAIIALGVLLALTVFLWQMPLDGGDFADGNCPCPQPQPTPGPSPGPAPFQPGSKHEVVVILCEQCYWSQKQRNEWPKDSRYPVRWVSNTREVVQKYKIQGTPTLLVVDRQGVEVQRQLGYLTPEKLRQWLDK